MSERARTGRWLALVAPGLPQLVGGRWGAGLAALGTWLGGVALLVLRPGRVAGALAGPSDARIALAALTAGMVTAWLWSVRESVGGGSGRSTASRTLADRPLAVLGLLVLLIAAMAAVLAPLLAPHDPLAVVAEVRQAPSWTHPMGTDRIGRDVFSRILYGARVSLSIGVLAMGLSATLGTAVGAVAGYAGGWVDGLLMRTVDLFLSFPRLVLLIAVVAVFEPSLPTLVLVIGLTQWPGTARLVRGEVLSLREREFVEAARALGFSRARILLRHVVPNTLAPVIVATTLGIGNVILLEAGLSFLGLGISMPTPSWGAMIDAARQDLPLFDTWWLSVYPGLALVLVVVAINLVGDGLRDALDPRLRGVR